MDDYQKRILSREDREKEIADAKRQVARIKAIKEEMPEGVDIAALNKQLMRYCYKAVSHRRAIECSPDELREKIVEYFRDRQVIIQDDEGNVIGVKPTAPITFTGLANHLGISRRTLLRYQQNSDEYGPLICTARSYIEEIYEDKLLYGKGNPAGVIFGLKNSGGDWADVHQMEFHDNGPRPMTAAEIEAAVNDDVI